jgi:hypothetical protein
MTWDIDAARARIGLAEGDAAQDTSLEAAMDTALAVAESYCDRRFLLEDDTQEFSEPIPATLLVRRWPLAKLTSLMPLEPLPEPPPDPVEIPSTWRMDKKKGMVFIVGMPPWITPVGMAPPADFVWRSGTPGRLGFVLAYTGGYDPLPADLEAALWMTFDALWGSTPGWGVPAGQQGSSGPVKSFSIDGTRIDYDTQSAAGGGANSKAAARGILPATAIGILDFYRAETAALGG